MLHGYRARWHGAELAATPDPQPDQLLIRLYHETPADGFNEVAPHRYVRVVPAAECAEILYVTTVCEWMDAPFQVRDKHDDELLLEYTGGQVPVARSLGLQRIERGVYQAWVPRSEVKGLRESATPVSIGR